MTDFNITARDLLANPGKVFEEMNKFTPGGLKTSRSKRAVPPFNFTTFNLSEILMRIPAFESPDKALSLHQSLIAGTMGSFWDSDLAESFGSFLPPDLAAMLEASDPDDGSEDNRDSSGIDGGGGSSDSDVSIGRLGQYRREGITPSTKSIPSGVKPVTQFGARVVREVLGFDGTIGGMRPYVNGRSDHERGYAIDVMVGYGSPKQKELGDMIADFFYHNRSSLKVRYIVWYDQITSDVRKWKWEWYDAKRILGTANTTTRHLDHPHISFINGAGAPVNPRLEWPDGYLIDRVGRHDEPTPV